MIPGWILLLVSAGYVGVLFVVAYYGDQRETTPRARWMRPAVYSLALAVYCSSWTFYGAVGTAARTGLGFLPIYLGPLLMLAFGWRILERLVLISGEHRIVSIADFLSSRYGRAPGLAALVAAVALTAAVPYVALQFKAVAMSVEVLADVRADAGLLSDPAFYVALLLAVFAILFGTRQIDATEHHRGMVLAIALESLVKLLAFLAIGAFALMHLPGTGNLVERMVQAAPVVMAPGLPAGFVAQTLLAFAAIICLPRQFHVAVVECQDPSDLRSARWWFGGYLVLISLLVVPITLAGQALLAGTGASPDTYVLALPLALQQETLALIVYIGGFSAATGMVIVASVALATMVSNDLIMPLLLRGGALHDSRHRQAGAVGAPRHHPGAGDDGLRLPPRLGVLRRRRGHAGPARPARVRRGRAVRAGVDRRTVLARREPFGRVRRPVRRHRAVAVHAAVAGAGARRLVRHGLDRAGARSASTGCARSSCSDCTAGTRSRTARSGRSCSTSACSCSSRCGSGRACRNSCWRRRSSIPTCSAPRSGPEAGPAACAAESCWRWPNASSASATRDARSRNTRSSRAAPGSPNNPPTARWRSSPNACSPRRSARHRRDSR